MSINKEAKINKLTMTPDKKLWLLLIFIIVIATFFVSEGTSNLFEMGILNSAYDSLAESLLKFEVDVDLDTIAWETFTVAGKHYMYFGPFPAFMRIVLNFINNDLYGQWARLSQIFAYSICIIFISRSLLLALALNTTLQERARFILAAVSIILFAFASPLFFLLSQISIYMEAMIWGLAFSCGAIYFFFKYRFGQGDKVLNLFLMSVLIGLALITRVTFAVPLSCIFFTALIRIFFDCNIAKYKIMLILAPLALMIGLQMWYNFKRFGSAFNSYDVQYYRIGYISPRGDNSSRVLEKIYKLQIFDPSRIPRTLKAYFLDSNEIFSSKFPYVQFSKPRIANADNYSYVENIFPFYLLSSWLLIFSTMGFCYLWFSNLDWETKSASLFLLLGLLPLLSYYAIMQRYVAEFIPLFLYLYLFFLNKFRFAIFKKKIFILILIIIISGSSIYTTVASSLWFKAFIYRHRPTAIRTRSFLRRIDQSIKDLVKVSLVNS